MAEYQALEFYAESARVVAKQGSEFVRKVKERGSWQIVRWTEVDLDALAKPLHNHNTSRQTSLVSRETAISIIATKWEEAHAQYIRQYNPSEKFVKKM